MGRGSSKGGGGGGATLEKKSEEWFYDKLNMREQAVVTAYSTYNFTRDEGRSEDKNTLENALGKYNLDREITTYRGVSEEEFVSTLFGDDSKTTFKSTSTDKSRAEAFARNQGGYIIEYHIAKGKHGAYLDGGVPGSNEKEFLINRGQNTKIISAKGKKMIIKIG